MPSRFILLFLVAAGCTPAPTDENPDPNCNPFAAGDCVLPWPSSYYQQADGHLAIPSGVLPANQVGNALDPSRLNQLAGWSPAGPILAHFDARLDPAQLPPSTDLTRSLDAAATVQLLRFDTGERVPLFAEVDHNVAPEDMSEVPLLLVHPMVRLQPKTRYVVALRGLKDENGNLVHDKPFDALVEGRTLPDGSRLAALRPRYEEIFSFLDKQGIPRDTLTLAWDFTTGDDAQLTSHLLTMRDQALAAWEQGGYGYTVEQVTEPTDDHLFREITGTFDAPSFLVDDTAKAALLTDGSGNPMLRGKQTFPLVVHVPKCALTATKPLPIMIFGHGLFGSAIGEMNSGYEKQVIDQLCMVQVGTDWIGLSTNDITNAANAIGDFNKFYVIGDRLQQAETNFIVLARLAIRKLKDDPNLAINGTPVTDGSEIYYYGISQGGIEGNTFMALDPDVQRGVVDVAGGEYSFMLFRSADFKMLKALLDNTYPAQRDQQILLAYSQTEFDWSDPITWVPHTLLDPLPDETGKKMAPKHVILQEATNDAQVPNLATRIVVRTEGLPLLSPSVEKVYGVPEMGGPLDAAYTQWDVHPMPIPGPYDTPPDDNPAHEAIRRLPDLINQLAAFFTPTGQVIATCDGPCDPE